MFRQPALFWSGNIAGGGDRSGRHGGVFVGMDDKFIFRMDTPVVRNYFFDRIILGLLLAARVEKPLMVDNISSKIRS